MTFEPSDKKALSSGFLASSLVAAILFAAFTYSTETAGLQNPGYFCVLLLVGAAFSTGVCAVLALPAFLILGRVVILTVWWALLTGAIAGAAVAIATEWLPGSLNDLLSFDWHAHAVGRAFAFSVIGGVSGFGFWWGYKRSLRDSTRESGL